MARKKAVKAILPDGIEGIDQHLDRIASCNRKIQEIETNLNDNISSLTRTAVSRTYHLAQEREALEKGISQFAKRNRSKLTNEGALKTVVFPHGEISWRQAPFKVSIEGGVEGVIERCEKKGLKQFVKVKKTLKRDVMLREREVASKIKGVTIKRGNEKFTISYYESEVDSRN